MLGVCCFWRVFTCLLVFCWVFVVFGCFVLLSCWLFVGFLLCLVVFFVLVFCCIIQYRMSGGDVLCDAFGCFEMFLFLEVFSFSGMQIGGDLLGDYGCRFGVI